MQKPQLFTFPFAGGNCYSFQFMTSELSDFEVVHLELPGRGKRITETLLRRFEPAVNDLFQQIISHLKGELFLIYGHSMGAILGLRVAHRLEQCGNKAAALIFSGSAGPVTNNYEPIYELDTPDFKHFLEKLGGIPKEVLYNKALFPVFEPILRADFEISERAMKHSFNPVNSPLYAVMGRDEDGACQIENWRKYTTSEFKQQLLEGGHFFIHQHTLQMSTIITSAFQGRPSL